MGGRERTGEEEERAGRGRKRRETGGGRGGGREGRREKEREGGRLSNM